MKSYKYFFTQKSAMGMNLLIERPAFRRHSERKIAIGVWSFSLPDDASVHWSTHLHDAVLWSTCDNIVIVWTPGDIENGAFMASNERVISWDSTDLEDDSLHNYSRKTRKSPALHKQTLLWGRTTNAPPPADSTMIARNFGLTAQKVESQLLFDTRILS